MHTHKRENKDEKWGKKKPPTESFSFLTPPQHRLSPCPLSSWLSHLSQALHLQFSHSVCGYNYSCPSLRFSLNNSIPQRPRAHYDSQSKFDFSFHLHSINSAICLILYLKCSSGCQVSVCLGKGRGTVLEKLQWWMTGEISRDVREGGEKSLNQQQRQEGETSQEHHLFLLLLSFFILAQRELLSG